MGRRCDNCGSVADCKAKGLVSAESCTEWHPGTSASMVDLMSKSELRHQLDTQTSVIVDIENRSARLERILNMCLSLKSEYRDTLVETKAKLAEMENPPRRILACDLCGKEIMPGRICRTCIIEQDGRSG